MSTTPIPSSRSGSRRSGSSRPTPTPSLRNSTASRSQRSSSTFSTSSARSRTHFEREGTAMEIQQTSVQKKHNPLLPFHKQVLKDIASPERDDLVVLSKGLGLRRIIANTLLLYSLPRHLVLLVNATPNDETSLGEQLSIMGVKKPGLRVVGYESGAKARKELYESGGLISVTSRILVVDMLTKNVPTEMITGLIVLHAERVTATSLEAFIVRLYRQENRNGFLKAFSDEAESFSYGIGPLQAVMKNLCLRTVHLWPRFHAKVHESLGRRKADVIELHQPMSPRMTEIQTAILECMEATLAELRRSNTSLDLDDITIENALFRNFDRIVRGQLDPVWHRVGPKTKKLVADLTELRKLLTYLISYDSITFNSYLETIIASNSTTRGNAKQNQSPWLFLDAANVLFSTAKKRAYVTKPKAGSARARSVTPMDLEEEEEWAALDEAEAGPSGSNGRQYNMNPQKGKWPEGVEPVIEELPKWGLLAQVLEEIEGEIAYGQAKGDETTVGSNAVLVMCSSDRTSMQLREYLSIMKPFKPGGEPNTERAGKSMMERLLKTYFFWKNGLQDISQSFKRATPDSSSEERPVSPADQRGGSFQRGAAPPNKRRRVRAGSMAANQAINRQRRKEGENMEIAGVIDLESEAGDIRNFIRASQTPGPSSTAASAAAGDDFEMLPSDPSQTLLIPSAQSAQNDVFDEAGFDSFYGLIAPEDTVIIRCYEGDDDEMVLQELRPRFIVMYDPDPAFVRRVEVYRSANPGLGVRVYFMLYADSVEEQKYLAGLRKEKDAFERLVKEKSTMMIPLNGDPRAPHAMESRARLLSTRNAGGGAASIEPSRVIVDMREFRSTLPAILHAADIQVIPATLQVGDYIITPTMVVERKAIPDLIQSMNSGRLYTQCEAMSTHYAQPILLIEFEENKSFSLTTMVDLKAQPTAKDKDKDPERKIKDGIDPTTLQSKLVLLTLTFPRLRIIWSSSPHATVDIISDLKLNHPEPDPAKAITIGGEEDPSLAENDGGQSGLYNQGPQEMLRALPGITSRNWKLVVSRVDSIKELCEVETLAKMQEILGGVDQGKALWDFLHKDAR